MVSREAPGLVKRLEDITECCICCETFTDPRMLPCIHTFCFKCLRETGLQMKKRPGSVMPCPLCKERFTIPEKGWEELKKNFFMIKLIEMTSAAKSLNESELICSDCKTRSQAETSTHCIQCFKNLCSLCCEEHRKHNPSHQLRANSTVSKTATAKLSAKAFCRLHPKKSTDLCCTDCCECICADCLAAGHRGHSCCKLDSASVEFKKKINKAIEGVSSCMVNCKAKKDQLQTGKTQFLEEIKNLEQEVTNHGRELEALAQKHTESLLQELSIITQRHLRKIEIENSEAERHLALSESFRQYCTDVCANGSSDNICQSIKNLQTMSDEMQVLIESCIERKLSVDQVFLKKTKLNTFVECTLQFDFIGGIKVLSKPIVDLKKRLDVAAKGIHGVAKLSGSICVLCREPNSIFVYADQSPFDFTKEIKAEFIGQPQDMAACAQSKCVYITDGYNIYTGAGNRCVWKITEEAVVSVWLLNVGSPWTISLCKDGHVIMLRDDGYRAYLQVFQSDSILKHNLLLPTDVREPLHAVESSTGSFVVSCRYRGVWSLCQISLEGHLVTTFLPATDQERLDCPSYLAKYFDDCIVVADRRNHRVLQLNLKPKNCQIILTRTDDAIKSPRQLLYDPDTKQLLVVHGVSKGRKLLDIYSLN